MYKNQLYFYTLIKSYQKDKLRKQSHLQLCIKKNKIPMNKFNQADERPVHWKQ